MKAKTDCENCGAKYIWAYSGKRKFENGALYSLGDYPGSRECRECGSSFICVTSIVKEKK